MEELKNMNGSANGNAYQVNDESMCPFLNGEMKQTAGGGTTKSGLVAQRLKFKYPASTL